ncbi:MAG: hypothetical protein IJ346_06925 [Clostridia bacterium]|nr:hypothetical protein [Clostridia bacterium]
MKNKIIISASLNLALCVIWSVVFVNVLGSLTGLIPGIIFGLAIGVGLTMIFTSGNKKNK